MTRNSHVWLNIGITAGLLIVGSTSAAVAKHDELAEPFRRALYSENETFQNTSDRWIEIEYVSARCASDDRLLLETSLTENHIYEIRVPGDSAPNAASNIAVLIHLAPGESIYFSGITSAVCNVELSGHYN